MQQFIVLMGIVLSFSVTKAAPQSSSAEHEVKRQMYWVVTQIFIGDKLMSAPKVSVFANEPVSLSQIGDKSRLDFSLTLTKQKTEDPNHFIVETKLSYKNDGKKIDSSPQISVLANSGEESTVEVRETEGGKNKSQNVKIIVKVDDIK